MQYHPTHQVATDLASETAFAFSQAMLDSLAEQGLSVHYHSDFRRFIDTIHAVEGGYGEIVNPAFDPRFNRLDWSNSLWLEAVDETDKTIALVAGKVLPDGNLYDLMQSRRVWYSRGVRPLVPGEHFEMLHEGLRSVDGRLTVSGCVWVHPGYRGRKVSSYMPLLARAVMLRSFGSTWHLGMVKQALHDRSMGTKAYHYPRAELCLRWLIPPAIEPLQMYVCYASRDETLTMMQSWLDAPEAAV